MSKNQQQKDWYKKTLEKIDNIMSSDKDIADKYLEIYKYTRTALDGEPTTADEYNDEEDVQLGSSIVKSNDEVSGVFMSDGKIEQIDYEYNDVISQYEDHEIQSEIKDFIQHRDTGDENDFGETRNAQNFSASNEHNESESRRGQGYDYGEFEDENDFDVSPDAPPVLLGTLIPENTVRISDINKEIAKEWNRDREEAINKEKTK